MKKVSNQELSQVSGGKFWGKKLQCEMRGDVCWCRYIYYKFGIVTDKGVWGPVHISYCK